LTAKKESRRLDSKLQVSLLKLKNPPILLKLKRSKRKKTKERRLGHPLQSSDPSPLSTKSSDVSRRRWTTL
jgi:hypothetical protein